MTSLAIACVVDEPMPSRDTLTVQVVQTLSALVRAGAAVDLYLPVPPTGAHPTPDALREAMRAHYQADCGFQVRLLPGLVPGGRGAQKFAQAALAARPSLGGKYDLLYSRIVLPMLAALTVNRPVLFETYRPLTRQYPLSRLPFRAVARHPAFLGLVTHSEYTRTAFVEDGLPPEKVRTLYNGYDASAFLTRFTPAEARAALGLPERPTFMYAGRIAPLKRIELLLDAAAALPEVQLVLVGGNDTAEAAPYVARARALPNVSLIGYVTGGKLAQALQAADVLVIPPSAAPLEQFGNTVLPIKVFEYLAAGRAIITGEVADTAELLLQGENAERIKPDDVGALVDALRRLFADETYRAGLGERARARAAELTWDARAGRLLDWMQTRLAAR
jgi:glycosyltransferase involved in cell wall biosynthesis